LLAGLRGPNFANLRGLVTKGPFIERVTPLVLAVSRIFPAFAAVDEE